MTYKLTKKQKQAFQREKKAYNERVRYHVNKWKQKYPDMAAEDIMRSGIVPWKMNKKLKDINSKQEYQALMRTMKHSKTKVFKKQIVHDVREVMKDVLDIAYNTTQVQHDALKKVIDKMSAEDIMHFKLDNPKIIRNYYLAYDVNYNGATHAITEDPSNGLLSVMKALRKYDKTGALNDSIEDLERTIAASKPKPKKKKTAKKTSKKKRSVKK